MKYAVALAISAIAAPAASPTIAQAQITEAAIPTPYFIHLDLVKHIRCGNLLGSGALIDSDLVLTAYHVVKPGNCTIDDKPVVVAFADPAKDYAVLRTSVKYDLRIPISCNGVREGDEYFAIGWALGTDFVVQHMVGTRSHGRGKFHGMAVLRGNNYPGMSGGPIVDDRGYIVGIVNAGPRNGLSDALSRMTADMYMCAK